MWSLILFIACIIIFIGCVFSILEKENIDKSLKISAILILISAFILICIVSNESEKSAYINILQGKKNPYHFEIKNTYQNNKLVSSDTLLIKNLK